MTDTAHHSDDAPSPLTDPEALRDRDDVEFVESTRAFPDDQFEALRERYQTIDGVVLVGVTTDDSVLLWGDDDWAPPGGNVGPDEDWTAAARRHAEDVTGRDVTVDGPVAVEYNEFHREGDETDSFPAPVVHFELSLPDADDAFLDDPTIPADAENDLIEEDTRLAWFDGVPDDVHPEHERHAELYLE